MLIKDSTWSLHGHYTVTARSLHGHYTVTTRSLRGHHAVTTRSLRHCDAAKLLERRNGKLHASHLLSMAKSSCQKFGKNEALRGLRQLLSPGRAGASSPHPRHRCVVVATSSPRSHRVVTSSVSFRGTSTEPQGLWAFHTAHCTERARSTVFSLCCTSAVGVLSLGP